MTTEQRQSLEQEVLAFVQREVPKPRPPLTLDTTLTDLRMVWEDAEDLLIRFFEHFKVEHGSFRFDDYVHAPRFFLFRLTKPVPTKPLSIRMLVDAAERGRWVPH